MIRGERHLSANYADSAENRNTSPSWVNLATEMNEKDTYGVLNQNVAGMIFIYACIILKNFILTDVKNTRQNIYILFQAHTSNAWPSYSTSIVLPNPMFALAIQPMR